MMKTSRRGFCLGGASLAALALGGPAGRSAGAAERPALPIPAELRPDASGVVALHVQKGERSFLPGVTTPTYGINGPFLGPAVRVRRGQKVLMQPTNGLDELLTMHWHGLKIPGAVDGGPYNLIQPGATWHAELTIDQPAATCWFHPHVYPTTAEQVIKGLAGLFVIDDDEADALGLPSSWGRDDIPLILQDRRFNPDGSFFHRFNMVAITTGYIGNTMLVNGAVHPQARTARGWLRLRLLNGSNARTYRLKVADDRPLFVIASDGGLLAEPARVAELPIYAGERYEVLVDARDGKPFDLLTLPVTQMGMSLPPFDRPLSILTILPDGPEGKSRLPDALVPLPPLVKDLPPVSQELVMGMLRDAEGMALLTKAGLPGMDMGGTGTAMGGASGATGAGMAMKGSSAAPDTGMAMKMGTAMSGGAGMKGADMAMAMPAGMDPVVVERIVRLITEGPALPLEQQLAANTVNGRPFSMDEVPFGAKRGQDLRWRISEKSDTMLHPVHIHGCQFRILSLNGKAPPAHLSGWKDTAPIDNGGSCEIQVRFEHPAPTETPYMAHCHNLEHEDSGMMTSFSVT